MKRFLLCLLLPTATLIAKETTFAPPAQPAEYSASKALADLASPAEVAAMQRLRSWSLHQSFGDAQENKAALEQPRNALALWLALSTHAIEVKATSPAEACDLLNHLHRQKALSAATVAFFSQLWHDKAPQPQRAADFLRGWLQEQAVPALSAAETAAIQAAIRAGCTALSCFEKNSPAVQSPPKP
ncbi:MAG: hypothetical protein IPK32_08055 [Verrucomicrobiaceae bacterium]|nr:hypothetical protein [Verrucomicrobiaceae bacterium]